MTEREFEILREWIDHRGHLSAMIRQGRNQDHDPKRQAKLHARLDEIDRNAKVQLCANNS